MFKVVHRDYQQTCLEFDGRNQVYATFSALGAGYQAVVLQAWQGLVVFDHLVSID